MGRNKKKSKAVAESDPVSSEEEEENDPVAETEAQLQAEPPQSVSTMKPTGGKKKRQAKAPAHTAPATAAAGSASDSEDDDDSGDDNAHGGGAGAAGSEQGSEDDEDAPKKKKKEYKGNRLNKQQPKAAKGKKGAASASTKHGGAGGAGSGDDEGSGSDDDEGPITVTRQEPVEVLYCPICTFPAEMCEFSGMMDKCRPWLLEHAAELADAEERGRKRRILTEKERLEAMLEGRGVKKALERIVVIDVQRRTGRRMITSVFGMDLFGFNMTDLSREWRKTFSCGAGVRAAEEGKNQDCIDIQGSVAEQLAELMVTKYKIPRESVFIMENKKKVAFFKD